jgi:hypothetical protein
MHFYCINLFFNYIQIAISKKKACFLGLHREEGNTAVHPISCKVNQTILTIQIPGLAQKICQIARRGAQWGK